MIAGKYSAKFEWLQASTLKETTYGQEKMTWSNNGELWCEVEELSASEQLGYGATMSEATARIRVRQYPGVRAVDRLESKTWNEVYQIDGVYRGNNEEICLAHRIPVTPS